MRRRLLGAFVLGMVVGIVIIGAVYGYLTPAAAAALPAGRYDCHPVQQGTRDGFACLIGDGP